MKQKDPQLEHSSINAPSPWIRFAVLAGVLILLNACEKKNEPTPNPVTNHPSITGFTPSIGIAGDKVNIQGNFPGGGTPLVTFNGAQATLHSRTSSELLVEVPPNGLSGPISIVLGDTTLVSESIFTVKPKITSIFPYASLIGGMITIKGSGFDPASLILKLNGTQIDPVSFSPTTVTAIVPPEVGEGIATITVGGNTAESPYPFVGFLSSVTIGGGPGDQYVRVLATDPMGNSFVAGQFTGSATIGGNLLLSAGQDDIFIAKYDANLNLVWASRAGGPWMDHPAAIIVDGNGSIYLGGEVSPNATFGTLTSSTTGNNTAFVAKLNSDGQFLWIKETPGSHSSWIGDITVDINGDILGIGTFYESIQVGPTSHTTSSPGYSDVFLCRLRASDGEFLFSDSYGDIWTEQGLNIASDNSGNIFISGIFQGDTKIGSTTLVGYGHYDSFVGRLTPNGIVQWVTHFAGDGQELVSSLKTSQNKVFAGGHYTGNATIAAQYVPTTGEEDAFIVQLDGSTGTRDWLVSGTGTAKAAIIDMLVTTDGYCLALGYHTGSVRFAELTSVANPGAKETFLIKVSPTGVPFWGLITQGTGETEPHSIGFGNSAIYMVGWVSNPRTFITTPVSTQSTDYFLWKVSY